MSDYENIDINDYIEVSNNDLLKKINTIENLLLNLQKEIQKKNQKEEEENKTEQFFSENGFFVVPDNVKFVNVILIGGGAGGCITKTSLVKGGESGHIKFGKIDCSKIKMLEIIIGQGGIGERYFEEQKMDGQPTIIKHGSEILCRAGGGSSKHSKYYNFYKLNKSSIFWYYFTLGNSGSSSYYGGGGAGGIIYKNHSIKANRNLDSVFNHPEFQSQITEFRKNYLPGNGGEGYKCVIVKFFVHISIFYPSYRFFEKIIKNICLCS